MTARGPQDDDASYAKTAIELGTRTQSRSGMTGYAPTVTPDTLDASVGSTARPLEEGGFVERYAERELLGEGGMGEVRLYEDARIGRDVAMKVIRPGHGSRSDLRSRFLREARVQGQLEHPAIVPVYDLGVNPDGAAYFTMKRVRGMTLEEVIDGLRQRDPEVVAMHSRRKLLTAFGSVCLAIDFAHARGVLHRDLKPGNVMLGGFGEVYVLDWGVAKLGDVPDPEVAFGVQAGSDLGATEVGAVLGTPGYMPPEQMLSGDLDARTDVYALGAVLFEILTLEQLHGKTKLEAVIASTLAGVDVPARCVSVADVPPELVAICARATATAPSDRFTTAREMHEALERFLDGDRDLEQRRVMAGIHAEAARLATERALGSPAGEVESRRDAMRELGRALALDPNNTDALRTMVRLVSEPPAEVPAEAQAEIDRTKDHAAQVTSTAGTWAFASWFLYFPFVYAMGVRDWQPLTIAGAFMLLAAALTFATRRQNPARRLRVAFLALACTSASAAFTSRVFGPFVIAPQIILASVVGFALYHEKKHRVVGVIIGLLGIAVPAALEWWRVIPRSYEFKDGVMRIVPHVAGFSEPATLLFLAVTSIMVVVTTMMFVGWTRDNLAKVERRAQVQAWHFRQLAPDDAHPLKPRAEPLHECAPSAFIKSDRG